MSKSVELSGPTLADIEFAAKKLCSENKVEFDPYRIGVGTDYGTKVVVYLIEDAADSSR